MAECSTTLICSMASRLPTWKPSMRSRRLSSKFAQRFSRLYRDFSRKSMRTLWRRAPRTRASSARFSSGPWTWPRAARPGVRWARPQVPCSNSSGSSPTSSFTRRFARAPAAAFAWSFPAARRSQRTWRNSSGPSASPSIRAMDSRKPLRLCRATTP